MSESKINIGTLYDINKIAMKNINKLNTQDLLEQWTPIENFIYKNNYKYYMLLNREKYDFTLFVIKDREKYTLISTYCDLEECLKNRGDILSIEQKDNAFEIWIKDIETKEAFAYYFFPYDNGVIENGKDI